MQSVGWLDIHIRSDIKEIARFIFDLDLESIIRILTIVANLGNCEAKVLS